MDVAEIKGLMDAMAASNVAEMEVTKDGWTLRLVQRRGEPALATASGLPATNLEPFVPSSGRPAVLAPLSGTVHLSPAPGEPPFVAPGQAVTAGATVCVVEAMKVFNKVPAGHTGTVAEILVASGDEVEAGQALVRFD